MSLDFEETTSYEIAFVCKDFGEKTLTSRRVVTLNVVDVNDNSPQFEEKVTAVHLEDCMILIEMFFQFSFVTVNVCHRWYRKKLLKRYFVIFKWKCWNQKAVNL